MTSLGDSQHERFVEHFVRSQGPLYGYILSILPNRRGADDAFQQTSLVLWRKWEEFDPERDFLKWACGIARNVVRNHVRTASRDRLRFSEGVVELLTARHDELHDQLDPRRDALAKCMDELPKPHAAFLRRCYDRQSKLHDVARDLGMTANALYLRLRRLREVLFACIRRHLGEPGGGPSAEGAHG